MTVYVDEGVVWWGSIMCALERGCDVHGSLKIFLVAYIGIYVPPFTNAKLCHAKKSHAENYLEIVRAAVQLVGPQAAPGFT